MAKPIAFKPITVDFKADLQRRLEKAPDEHAAALLAAYDVLEAAYDEGLLDILHGLIASKDTIITTLSRYAKQPEGIAGIRNSADRRQDPHRTRSRGPRPRLQSDVERHRRTQTRAGPTEPLPTCQARQQRRWPPRALVRHAGSLEPGSLPQDTTLGI